MAAPDRERRHRLEELFLEVLDLDDEARRARLEDEDPELSGEVRHWLAAFRRADPWLEEGALAVVPELEARLRTATPGRRIGPYRILTELGRGGMGAVYLAERDDPTFPQRVALKLIKRGMDSEQIVRRFLVERRILAGLIHPSIARLLDGGSTDDGRPYFVLEYVAGEPITTFVRERRLALEARLRLVLEVCRAVQYAHQKLIVHRDLKPANILVDPRGSPKLLDFGIAKLLDPREASPTLTEQGSPLTPDYASPEQAAGEPVSTASDVYSLGVLLFELLTGVHPRRLPAGSPASRAVALGAGTAAERRRWARRLAGDLDTIVAKALEPDPRRRYPTAAALAEDVERYIDHRPVTARRPTLAYRWGRTLSRHRWAAAALLALVVLAGAAVMQSLELSHRQQRLTVQHDRAEALAAFLAGLFRFADPGESRGVSMTAREILDIGARRLLRAEGPSIGTDPQTRGSLMVEIGEVYTRLGLYPQALGMLEPAREVVCTNDDAPGCAEVLGALGRAHAQQGRYGEGEGLLRRALEATLRSSEGPTPALIEQLDLLGLVALEQGRFDEARDLFERALAACRSSPETPAELTAETLRSRANLEAELGRLDAATSDLREAVELFRSALGEDHPDTLRARNDLATVVYQRGEHGLAEQHFRDILRHRRRLLGPEHPEIAQGLNNLAVAQQALGRLEDAEASLRLALDLRRRSGTTSTLGMARSLGSLASVVRKQGRYEEAVEVYAQAAEALLTSVGEAHPELANIYQGWARAERSLGRPEPAEELARRAAEAALAVFGEAHSEVAEAWRLVADIVADGGRFDEAELLYRRAMSIARQLPVAERAGLAGAWIGLGRARIELGRAGEALTILEEGVDLRAGVHPGGAHPGGAHSGADWRLAVARAELGRCYLRLGRYDEAEALIEPAYHDLLERFGPETRATRLARVAFDELVTAPPTEGGVDRGPAAEI